MHKILVTACLLVTITLFHSILFSQWEVENFAPGSRAVGYGGSLVVQARDPSAIFWNPAALSGLKGRGFLLSINEPFGFNLVSLTQFVPLYGTYGIALARIPTPNESVDRGTIAWGRKIVRGFSIGSNFNIEKRKNDLFAAASIGFLLGNSNVGTLGYNWRDLTNAELLDKLNFGVTIHNIPLSDKLFETSALLGFSYIFPSIRLLLNAGYHISEENNTGHLGLGFELTRNLTIFSGIEEWETNKVGVGFSYTHDNFIFDFTYATEFERILFTFSARISPSPEVLAEPYYERGSSYVKSRNYKLATREFKKFLSYELNESKTDTARQIVSVLQKTVARLQVKVDSLFSIAEKLLSQDEPRYLRAARVFIKILELDKDNLEASRKLATIKPVVDDFVNRSFEEGINEFDSKRYFAAKEIFNRVLLFDKDNDVALNYLSEIDRILDDLAEEYFYRGVGYYRQKSYIKAKQEFLRALQHNPDLGEANSYLKRTDKKFQELRKRIANLFQAGQKFELRGKYVEAANKYLQVLKLEQKNQEAKDRLAKLRPKINRFVEKKLRAGVQYVRQEKFAEALEAFLTVLSIDPDHKAARRNLSNLRKEKKEKAQSYFSQAEGHFRNQNWQDALELYTKTLKIDPTHAMAVQRKKETERQLQIFNLFQDGRNKYNAEQYIEALEIFEQIVRLDPTNERARNEISSCRIKINALVEKYFNEGIDLYTLDRYDEAIERWNQALKLNPKHKSSLNYKQKAMERLKALEALKNNE
ncbi:MAG: tetratricopeptide repeat protein [bacterium]